MEDVEFYTHAEILTLTDEEFLELNPSLSLEDKGGWIQKAIKNPGSFTKQAKRAGMSTHAYAKHVLKPGSRASATTKRRANLAKTLGSMRKGKK